MRILILAALMLGALQSGTAEAAATFRYTARQELYATDAASGTRLSGGSQRVADGVQATLGVTGTVAVARRKVWVQEGGQLFIQARLPQSMASQAHDLDVYVADAGGMSLRGAMRYTPGRGLLVARTFLLPDLPVGPVVTEIHVRGAHSADWQEILTQRVLVPKQARLRFAFAAAGTEKQDTPLELVVEARDEDDPSRAPLEVYRHRLVPGGGRTDWKEVSQRVEKLAGRNVRLAFRSRPTGGGEGTAAGVIWGTPTIERDEERRAYPVILVVSLDSLRTSAVGLYSGGEATPALDAFFARGVTLMQAVTQSVTTLPAHMTLMTGMTPHAHGVIDERRALPASAATLAESLQREGWRTAAFTEGGALAAEFGFGRGFDHYDEGKADHVSPSNADALERAAAWVDGHSQEPLFVFVHTYRTRPVHTGRAVTTEAARRREIGAAVEQVRSADAAFGKLIETLAGRTIEDRSLYVATSGHGEEFFEHGAAGHGTQLYEETVRVPLILRGGMLQRRVRAETQVGLMDVAPTILALVGADIPRSMLGESFDILARTGKGEASPRRWTEARRPFRLLANGTLTTWGLPSYSVREDDYKVIFHAGAGKSFEAYDLRTDQREQHNVAERGRAPDWARRLAGVVGDYPAQAGAQAPAAVLTPINRRRLQSLGYLQ